MQQFMCYVSVIKDELYACGLVATDRLKWLLY